VFPSEGFDLLFGRAGFAPGLFLGVLRVAVAAPIRQISTLLIRRPSTAVQWKEGEVS